MAVSVEEFDPFTAPLEELRARANAGEGPKSGEPLPGDRPRNADGTFATQPKTVTQQIVEATQDPDPADDPNADPGEEEEETIYQRRIDLGDGAGVQVFQAPSLEELVDKLVVAQENATKKIRQQQEEINKNRPMVKERSADEEFVISQELMSKPTAAFQKLFQETVGMPISEFKTSVEAVKAFNQGKAADDAAQKFVDMTPDYYATPANGKKLQGYLKAYNLPATLENITKAYSELHSDNLLVVKPAPVAGEEEQVIAQPAPKKKASGLSSRGGSAPVAKKAPSTLADFEQETAGMSLAQIKAKANAQ